MESSCCYLLPLDKNGKKPARTRPFLWRITHCYSFLSVANNNNNQSSTVLHSIWPTLLSMLPAIRYYYHRRGSDVWLWRTLKRLSLFTPGLPICCRKSIRRLVGDITMASVWVCPRSSLESQILRTDSRIFKKETCSPICKLLHTSFLMQMGLVLL